MLAWVYYDLITGKTLHLDHPRPVRPTYQGETQLIDLPGEVLRGLRNLAQRNQSTLYMVLLVAFDALLYHYNGQEDMLVDEPRKTLNDLSFEL